MPHVHKRVLKLVNFEVQKVQKPELFDLAATFPRLRGDQGPLGHVSHPGANFTTKETPGAICGNAKNIFNLFNFYLLVFPSDRVAGHHVAEDSLLTELTLSRSMKIQKLRQHQARIITYFIFKLRVLSHVHRLGSGEG